LFGGVAATSRPDRRRQRRNDVAASNYYLNQTDRIAFDKIKDSPDPAPLQDSSPIPDLELRCGANRIHDRARRSRASEQLARQQEALAPEEQRRPERERLGRWGAEALRKQETLRAGCAESP